jgi:hypothetical protein
MPGVQGQIPDRLGCSLLSNEGKFALIHDGDIIGTFDTYSDALNEGYKLFKLDPFLVKQIQAIEHIHFITHAAASLFVYIRRSCKKFLSRILK